MNKAEFENYEYWGLETTVNLGGCALEVMSDESKLREFVIELCKKIDMKTVGEPVLKRFGSGHLYGYSLMQLIETSSITGHFAEERKEIYLNIFSCKWFDGQAAAIFCKEFFKANEVQWMVVTRDIQYNTIKYFDINTVYDNMDEEVDE